MPPGSSITLSATLGAEVADLIGAIETWPSWTRKSFLRSAKGWNKVFAVSVFLLGNHLPPVTFARWLRDTTLLHDKDAVRQAIDLLNRF